MFNDNILDTITEIININGFYYIPKSARNIRIKKNKLVENYNTTKFDSFAKLKPNDNFNIKRKEIINDIMILDNAKELYNHNYQNPYLKDKIRMELDNLDENDEITPTNYFNNIEQRKVILSKLVSIIDEILFCFRYIELLTNNEDTMNMFSFLENSFSNGYDIEYLDDGFIIKHKKNKIHILDDLTKIISELNDLVNDTDIKLYFRGQSNLEHILIPSLYRNNNNLYENYYYKDVMAKYPNEFLNCRYTFDELTKMQHYQIPTRLLDITSNPLVALFFACHNKDIMGRLFVFKVHKDEFKYYDDDSISVLANIAKLNSSFNIEEIEKKYADINKNNEVHRLVHEIRREKPYFEDKILKETFHQTFFVKSKYNNNRIINQSGAFLLFGINKTRYEPSTFTNQNPDNVIYLIPSKTKPKMLRQLELLNIQQNTLFPELDKYFNS